MLILYTILAIAPMVQAQDAANITTNVVDYVNMTSWMQPDPDALSLEAQPLWSAGDRVISRYESADFDLKLKVYQYKDGFNSTEWQAFSSDLSEAENWYNAFGEAESTMPSQMSQFPVKVYQGEYTTLKGEKLQVERRVALTKDKASGKMRLLVIDSIR